MHGTAFHNLYEAHARDVYRFARFLTASDDAAAEITSETFLRAWVGRCYVIHRQVRLVGS